MTIVSPLARSRPSAYIPRRGVQVSLGFQSMVYVCRMQRVLSQCGWTLASSCRDESMEPRPSHGTAAIGWHLTITGCLVPRGSHGWTFSRLSWLWRSPCPRGYQVGPGAHYPQSWSHLSIVCPYWSTGRRNLAPVEWARAMESPYLPQASDMPGRFFVALDVRSSIDAGSGLF